MLKVSYLLFQKQIKAAPALLQKLSKNVFLLPEFLSFRVLH